MCWSLLCPEDQVSIAFASANLPFSQDTLRQLAQQSGETEFAILDMPTLHALINESP